jgi:serine/threonine protein kinase
MWSLGITAIELAEGTPPHAGVNPLTAIFLIPTLPPPTLKASDWSPRFTRYAVLASFCHLRPVDEMCVCRSFLERCLIKEPGSRAHARELASDPMVQAGRIAQKDGVLRHLMAQSREPLRAYREEQALKAQAEAAAEAQADNRKGLAVGGTAKLEPRDVDEPSPPHGTVGHCRAASHFAQHSSKALTSPAPSLFDHCHAQSL